MKKSEPCDQLYTALASARANFGIASRTKTAKISSDKATYSYSYAPLEECFNAIDKALSEQGLALVGGVEYGEDGRLWVITHLGHTSGQWIENALDCGIPKNIKEMGGMLTYARRYGVTLTVQMQAEDDDDGNHGGNEEIQQRPSPKKSSVGGRRGKPDRQEQELGNGDSDVGSEQVKAFLLDQIMTTLKRVAPSASVEDREHRRHLIGEAFAVTGWSKLKELSASELESGYQRLMERVSPKAVTSPDAESDDEDDVPLTYGPDAPASPQDDAEDATSTHEASDSEHGTTGEAEPLTDERKSWPYVAMEDLDRVMAYAQEHGLERELKDTLQRYPNGITPQRLAEVEATLKARVSQSGATV